MNSRRLIALLRTLDDAIVAGQTRGLEAVRSGLSDVRLGSKSDISKCPTDVRFTPKSTIHAPCALERWIDVLPRDRPIAVYCICGFQVSGTAVTELRRRGYDAMALVGGITAWHAIGGATVPLDTSTYEEKS
jgi:rhodanese-related sulfurtransferase